MRDLARGLSTEPLESRGRRGSVAAATPAEAEQASQRNRNRSSSGQRPVSRVSRVSQALSTEEEEGEREATVAQQNPAGETKEVVITFDGAARGNGTGNVRCSYGVFVNGSYSDPQTHGCVIDDVRHVVSAGRDNYRYLPEQERRITNNSAELSAAIAAAKAAVEIAGKSDAELTFIFKGDSRLVCIGVMEGRILSYSARNSTTVNAALWNELRVQLDLLQRLGHRYSFDYVERGLNKEADELANAALDARAVNTSVVSPKSPVPITVEMLQKICEGLMTKHRPTLRTIPGSVSQHWVFFCLRILEMYNHGDGRNFDRERCRLLFMLAPHLLALGCGKTVRGRSDFDRLRSHLILLQTPHYLQQCLHELFDDFTREAQADGSSSTSAPDVEGFARPFSDRNSDAEAESRRLRTLCSRGLFSKAVPTEEIHIAKPTAQNVARLQAMFPDQDLPRPLRSTAGHHVPLQVSFADIARAVRITKRGKACAFSGWTRELMFPIFAQMQLPHVRAAIEGIFRDYIAVTPLLPVEKRLLQNGVLVPFEYQQAAADRLPKLRPITILEYFLKICFVILLQNVYERDQVLAKSSHTMFRAGGSQLAVATIVAALEDERVVLGLDGSNAFNTVSRQAAFDHIQRIPEYEHLHSLLNFLYCEQSESYWFHDNTRTVFKVKAGARQGCVSATWFFSCATLHAFRNLGHVEMTQVVDDTYLVGRQSQEHFDSVVDALASIGIAVNQEKTRIFAPPKVRDRSLLPRFRQMANDENRKFANPLGAVIQYPGTLDAWALEGARKWHEKAKKKISSIANLPTSAQNKFLILRSVLMHFVYAASTFHGTFRDALFQQLDDDIYDTFLKITDLRRSDELHVQSHLPIVDRGFGLLPYGKLHGIMLRFAWDRATMYARDRFPGLRMPYQPAEGGAMSINNQWRQWTRKQSVVEYTHSEQHNFLKTWPVNQYTTLSDEHFVFGCRLLARQLEPRAYLCPTTNPPTQLSRLEPAEYTEHMLTCKHCAAPGHYHRHEKVNNAIHRILRFGGITSSLNPKGYPLPDNTRGGADLFVNTEVADAVDVSIVRPHDFASLSKVLHTREQVKYRNYELFKRQTSFNIVPWVMSVYGEHGKAALEAARRWARRSCSTTLKSDLLTFTQMELIRGIELGVKLLHLRVQPLPQQLAGGTEGGIGNGGEVNYNTAFVDALYEEDKPDQLEDNEGGNEAPPAVAVEGENDGPAGSQGLDPRRSVYRFNV